ncbi:Collagen Alpha-1(Xx) Chain [Manis pentadactyla]|nr:Collagen Alpha-1(Xx) Chain [Manis pentadactyla]
MWGQVRACDPNTPTLELTCLGGNPDLHNSGGLWAVVLWFPNQEPRSTGMTEKNIFTPPVAVVEDLNSNAVSRRPLRTALEPTSSPAGSPDPEPRVTLTPRRDPLTPGGPKWRGGLTQCSGDPQTEWDLNTFGTKDKVPATVHILRYRGGNTFTGLALTHVLEQNLKPAAGSGPEAAKVVVLVTDGKSQDNVRAAGCILKDLGVDVFAVALRQMVVEGPPSSVQLNNLTSSTEYRESGSRGTRPVLMEAPGNATSAALSPHSSSTTYTVHVTCFYPGGSSSTLTGHVTTREWQRRSPQPELAVGDRAPRGQGLAGVDGHSGFWCAVYQIMWTPLGDGKAREISTRRNLCMAVLPGLRRHTEYDITVLAYSRDGAHSDPVSLRYAPSHLRFCFGLRIREVGSRSHVTLPDLPAATEYRVLVSAVYSAGESVAVSSTGRTGFDLMVALGLVETEYASIRGVAMEPSVSGQARAFTLLKHAQLTRRARWEGRGGL